MRKLHLFFHIVAYLVLSVSVGAQESVTRLHIGGPDGTDVGSVSCFAEDTTGMIWMGTEEGLVGYDGVGFEFYTVDNSELPGNVFAAIWAEPGGGRLWLGVKNGLAVMDLRCRRIKKVDIDGFYNIADLAPAEDGGLWILNVDYRFAHLDLHKDSVVTYEMRDFAGLPSSVLSLRDVGGGHLQMDGNSGRWDVDLATRRAEASALPPGWDAMQERRKFVDHNGNHWMDSADGLYCTSHIVSPFVKLPMTENGKTVAHCMMTTADGGLWIGYPDHLVLFDARRSISRSISSGKWKGPASFIPYTMEMEKDGNILIGMEAQGLWRYSPQMGTASQLSQFDPTRSVYTLHRQERAGRWLVGTSRGVCELRDGEDFLREVAPINKAISSYYIFALQTDCEGKIWVGIYGTGLQVFDKELRHVANLTPDTGFPSGAINHLFRDSRKRMWVATCEGVVCFPQMHRLDSFEVYTMADGLPTLYARAVCEDHDGRIWVTTTNRLARLDETTRHFCTYGSQGGLRHRFYCNAALRCLSDGSMAAGGEDGVSVFDPRAVAQPQPLPPLHLMSFVLLTTGVKGETVATIIPNDSLVFCHRDNTYRLTFGLADMAQNGLIEYAYRIQPEGPWISLGDKPQLTLHSLQPGCYTVEVRARRMGQIWPECANCSVTLQVNPPWWQTWWAYMLYALAVFALIVYIMYSWRRSLLLENNLRYAEGVIEELRTNYPRNTSYDDEKMSDSSENIALKNLASFKRESDSRFIDSLTHSILENIDNPSLDIDMLTDRMAMSRSTLYRRVKSLLGMSANEYIRWVRLGEAARRIRRGDLSKHTIAGIAADCGFIDLHYFRTCFKERFGVTPSEFEQG